MLIIALLYFQLIGRPFFCYSLSRTEVTYTPKTLNSLTAGNYTDTFTLSASDSLGASQTQVFTVNITGVNDTPSFTSSAVTLSYTDTAGVDTFSSRNAAMPKCRLNQPHASPILQTMGSMAMSQEMWRDLII